MKSILVTGGAGYIGSVLTQLLLDAGYNVKVIDLLWFKKDIPLIYCNNPRYTFIKGDICDERLLEDVFKEDIDCIVHAAAVVGEPAGKKFPELLHRVNYEGSVNLISKAAEYGRKGLIFFSTCSNYGIGDGMATEESPLKPLSLYAQTKVEIERRLMANVKKLDWIICRLATAYGVSPRMRFDLTVNDFTLQARKGKKLELFLPHTYRPYIHVNDVGRVVVEMISHFEKFKNKVFNIGFNGENYQKIQVVEIIRKFMPELRVEIVKEGMDLRDYQVDFSKLGKFLGIKNAYSVEGGVKELIRLLDGGTIRDVEDRIYYNTSPDLEIEDEVGIRRA